MTSYKQSEYRKQKKSDYLFITYLKKIGNKTSDLHVSIITYYITLGLEVRM